jgi:integrase
VFTREDGQALRPDTFSERFRRAALAAGVPLIRFHDLRHTSATLGLAGGVHPKVMSERLGHSNIAITLGIYSHVSESMGAGAAATIAELIGV